MSEVDVVVVGGGPVGLALAGDLGWRGRSCELVEQSDGSIGQPKMDGVNVRTMEFCRRWGIVDAVKHCDYPANYPQDMVYLTSLAGYELGRESFLKPSTGDEQRDSAASPEARVRCPQNLFDPILRAFAESWPAVRLRYRRRFVSAVQHADRVEVQVEDVERGELRTIVAAYLVGCDGAASTVRAQLGLGMSGRPVLTYTTNVIVRHPTLAALHDKRLAYRHVFIGPEGTWATMVAINGRDEWRFSFIGSARAAQLSEGEVRALVDRALGFRTDYEIVSVLPWVRRELLADAYGRGRILIAGDAAHVMSPTGGFGMNTGIGDAVDLGWKLDAALDGWGGPSLLASYEAERRPVAERAIREASGNLRRTLSPGANPRLLEPTLEGALVRYDVGRRFAATMLREWYKNGIDLGYVYAGSPICWEDEGALLALSDSVELASVSPRPGGRLADGTPITAALLREWQRLCVHVAEGDPVAVEGPQLDAADAMLYRPSAAPGARAPHVWLDDGRSTLDLFGRGIVLLRVGPDAPTPEPLVDAARERGVPLAVQSLDTTRCAAVYRARLVLVRPDGHVAWRGDRWPAAGVGALLDRVRGASFAPSAYLEVAS